MSTTFSCLVPGAVSGTAALADWSALVIDHHLHGLWLRVTPTELVALVGNDSSIDHLIPVTFVLSTPLPTADVEQLATALDGWQGHDVSLVIGELEAIGQDGALDRSDSSIDEVAVVVDARRSGRRMRFGATLYPDAVRAAPASDPSVVPSVVHGVDFVVVSASAEAIVDSVGAGLPRRGNTPVEIAALVECMPSSAFGHQGRAPRSNDDGTDEAQRVAGLVTVRGGPAQIAEQLGHFIAAGVDEIVICLDTVADSGGGTVALAQARELARELPTERSAR